MNEVTKALLLDHHAGRTTSLQRKLIESWLLIPDNPAIYYDTLIEWESTHPQYVADVTVGLSRFNQRLAQAESRHSEILQEQPVHILNRRFSTSWLIAASITMLLAIGIIFRQSLLYKIYSTANGEVLQVELSDKSQVTMNANSTLKLSRFSWLAPNLTREVFLTGEAEFSITHFQDNRRFVVHTEQQLDIEVLGTEFVVLARNRATRVVLLKGKVKLHYKPKVGVEKSLFLSPGQKVTLNPRQAELVVAPALRPEEYNAWKNHQYVFDETPLSEIGQLIKDDFGLKVEIKDTLLAQRKVSGTYEVKQVSELLDALQELLAIKVTHHRSRVIFSQKAN